ncbi:MAG: CRTAC1 family protein [Thermoanaerobaculia bacterium]|nr:CRTAC1 family protein [Thermoanaerobaculia bacterium]
MHSRSSLVFLALLAVGVITVGSSGVGVATEETPHRVQSPPRESGGDDAVETRDATDEETSPPPGRASETGHERMVRLLRDLAREAREKSEFSARGPLKELRTRVASLPPDAPPERRFQAHLELGMTEFRYGKAEAAIRNLTAAKELLPPEATAPRLRKLREGILYHLGLAHLRQAELVNCIETHSRDSCIVPIRGGGIHRDETGSRAALEHFRELLSGAPPGSTMEAAVRWLSNIAYMTLGLYPEGVPPEILIPPSVFRNEVEFPRFSDVARDVGLAVFDWAGGAGVEDYDGDGLLDVLTSSFEPGTPLKLHLADGEGGFVETTEEAGLRGLTGGLNLIHADYDNDGDVDVYVLRGAWLLGEGRHPNSLLRNDGDGTFTDVTFDVGLGENHYPTQTAAWGDYDLDGDLDLYVGNEAGDENPYPSQLFRNQGDGTFTEVAAEAGVEDGSFTKAVVWGDYDGDRFPDLYVSNFQGSNRLYHNDGDGTFTDVAGAAGVSLPLQSFPCWFWDYDNDGALDLYVSSYPRGIGRERLYLAVADHLGWPSPGETQRLYRGDGNGGFRDVTEAVNLDRVLFPMGANWGDLDNDGYPDFYLGTGYPSWDALMPNLLFWNRRGESFQDVSFASGTAHLQKGHGVAFADLDYDGDQDLFHQLGGFYPQDAYTNALFENPGFGNHWLKVRLVGTRSNRSGVGARIRAVVREGDSERSVYRWVDSGGSFGANPLLQHLGLGEATEVERLEVYWPVSDQTQTFREIAADQTVRITEGREELEIVTREPIPFRSGGDETHRHPGPGGDGKSPDGG